ncbi:MAG: TraR/DksA C4-type zinc finger protein [Sedimenticola sp.]
MSEVGTDFFHQLLLKRQEALLSVAETAAEAADTVALDQTRMGRLSRMDALQAQAMSQEGNRRRDLELKRIALALRRIKEGEYGYCLDCGEVIAENRLKVDLSAPLCIGCAGKAER